MGYNDYDDEVERMRSRKSRAAGRRAAANQPARGRRRYEDEPEEYYDGDEADGEWLDEDYDEAGEAYDDDEYDDGDDGLEAVYLDEKPSTRPVRGRSAAASGLSLIHIWVSMVSPDWEITMASVLSSTSGSS